MLLARRNSPWSYGAGFTIAVAWNALDLFITHLMQAGMVVFWSFLQTGHMQRPDTMMVPLGGIGHFILMGSCLAAVIADKSQPRKWGKFVAGGALVMA